ncbi:MAG: multi-sensor signal transduction histidine kinase [Bacteroidetes bacterium]|nr:multi-sensor signal transduction histidine kinase [Bacteroidota bacterium]
MATSIRTKIVWTFAMLVMLSLGGSFWAIYNFYAMGTTVATILRENYQSVLAAENMVKLLERQDNALLAQSEGEEATMAGGFEDNKKLFFYWENQAAQWGALPTSQAILDSIRTAYGSYISYADSMISRNQQGAFTEARQYYYEVVRYHSDRLRELCFQLFQVNQSALVNAEARTHSIASQTAYGTMIVSIVILALSIISTAWLFKVVIKPAEELTEKVKEIGTGKLDLKIDVLSDDEIGQLSREFNKMTERLRRFEQMNIERIIAEKRKSEAIVESISDGLIVTDAHMRVIHVNTVIAELFGCKENEAATQPVASIIRDERVIALIRDSSNTDGEIKEPKESLLQFNTSGRQLFFRPKVTRIFDSEGMLYGVVTLLQDVTQFKELDRMKSDFIATVSHEFRTPVTSINMSVDILNQEILGPLNDRQKELIASAKEDCLRLTKLSREILQLSKIESGRLQLKDEDLDVRPLVESSVRPLQLQFQEKGVAVAFDISPSLPHLVADEQQLTSVVSNLVTNALKNTDRGGKVTVSAREEGNTLRVDVADTGQGISPENLEMIFDKFVQVKQSSDTTPGSVGLGLAIAKEIVEMYGGKIWASSTPGKGSVFSFVLPLPQHQPTPSA